MFPALQHPRRQDHYRSLAAFISAALHAVAFFALVHAPAVTLPRPSESEYKQAIAGREEKIVWYRFHDKLPNISPRPAESQKEPLRATEKAAQSIVSSARNAPPRKRVVWTPAPPVHDLKPLDAPNVVAMKLPPAVQPKPFVAPETNRPVAPQIIKQAAAAPELSPAAIVAARMPPAPRMPEAALAPKPFLSPPPAARQPSTRPHLAADAPQIVASATHAASIPNVALAPKLFHAPAQEVPRPPAAPAMAAEAPAMLAARPHGPAQTISPVLAPKPFTAPPSSRKIAPGAAATPAPESDAPVLQANSKDLNLAVVGLNPGNHDLPPLSSSPADFSAGPQLRATGSNSQPTSTALAVPGLFVGKTPQASRPDLFTDAFDSPTSPGRLRAAIASIKPQASSPETQSGAATSHSGAVRVAEAPEPRFAGRDVFMMAIQMPNLTSYSGSWLMWYASRSRQQAEREPIAAPVPHRKVDPKYTASAVAERVEGKVRLACVITKEGKVGGIELLRGLDDRLNLSAQEALGKWEFYPATRRGEPVDVDAVVEIPFRLEPRAPKP
jgi:TonB family protein